MLQHVGMATPSQLNSVAGRLEYVRDACEYPDWASLAKDLEFSPQAVDNWRKRQAIGPKGRKRLREKTGASIEWLESGTGEPFPDGAKRYIGYVPHTAGAAIARNTDSIDQLRATALVLIDVLTATRPDVAADIAERLGAVVHGEAARQPFHLTLLKNLRERALTTRQHSQPPAPRVTKSRKRAS